jgi:hypothetical protein
MRNHCASAVTLACSTSHICSHPGAYRLTPSRLCSKWSLDVRAKRSASAVHGTSESEQRSKHLKTEALQYWLPAWPKAVSTTCEAQKQPTMPCLFDDSCRAVALLRMDLYHARCEYTVSQKAPVCHLNIPFSSPCQAAGASHAQHSPSHNNIVVYTYRTHSL